MRLNDDERAMLDGRDGPAVRKAMELLVRYGQALGAERLVDTRNVAGTIGASTPFMRDFEARRGGMDAVFSEFNLDSAEVVEVPRFKVYTSHLQHGLDPEHPQEFGVTEEVVQVFRRGQSYAAARGMQMSNTCTPYLVGNVPVKGEHLAWMESSAVVYANGAIGARTNTEGRESAGAAALTGKIPYWGLHLPENRFGTHRVELEVDVRSTSEWGMLGYWIGEIVQERIPVVEGVREVPNLQRLKHFGAAAASSGGVEMYHLVGVTPEADSVEHAFGPKSPVEVLRYGPAERRATWEKLNVTARDRAVDYVMLGCPHYSIEQIWEACELLEGRRVHENTSLWIFTPRAIKALADQNGYTRILEDAGAKLMSDTCSAMSRAIPDGAKVAAFDSAKQVHYLPAIMGIQGWFGTTAQCIDAAVTGRFDAGPD
ncbi:MAG: aconitase X catalytic domain-containing protein [Burkholderiales bacterium]|nr:MAG: aconitase X catalytic domain-containing protein [Burkholderiales bacterium]